MSRRKCCCASCVVFADDFGRPNSSNLGSNWSERTVPVTGDWDIFGEELRENGNATAIVICQTETATEEQSVTVELPDLNTGDIYSLVCNYLDDDHYFFCELEHYDGGNSLYVRLYRHTAAGDAWLTTMSVPPMDGTPYGFQICFSETSFSVSSDTWMVYVCHATLLPIFIGGKKAGIRNGGTNVLTYDNFTLANFTGSDGTFDDRQCCEQQCQCGSGANQYCIPAGLIITLSASGCVHEWDGVEIPISWNPVLRHWESGAGAPPGLIDTDNIWTLKCGESACPEAEGTEGTFVLSTEMNSSYDCETHGDRCLVADDASSGSCDPLIISFPGVSWPGNPEDFDNCGGCGPANDMTTAGSWSAVVTIP